MDNLKRPVVVVTGNGQFGIVALKRGLVMIAAAVRSAFEIDSNDDNKISTAEKIAYATSLIPQVFPLVGMIPDIKNETKRGELTSAELDEVVQYVTTLDFLPDDKDEAEAYVKDVILWINYNRRFVAKTIKRFEKKGAEELEQPVFDVV